VTSLFTKSLVAGAATVLLCSTALTQQSLQARSISYELNIPAESLDAALQAVALASHHKLFYRAELVAGKASPALIGSYTTEEAVHRLLEGTQLSFEITPASVVLIKALDDKPLNVVPNSSGGSVQIASPGPSDDATVNGGGKQSSQEFRLAQVGQGKTTSDVPVDESDEQKAKDRKTEGLEEIIVTGTNISNVENKTVPLLSFDRDAIARSGYASLSDFITALPQNVKSGSNSADGILTGDFTNIENSTAANLRGLGASSTLTLINGHRVAAAAEGTGVDLSMIPLAAVERIEVLTDGSSAVYGADAVGGVVNIILRKDFNGQETDARLDTLSRGGGELKQFGQSVGRTWSTGGVLGVFQFDDNNALRSQQRSFTSALDQPSDVLPATKRYSGVFSVNQSLGASVEVFADALVQHNVGQRSITSGIPVQEQVLDSAGNSSSASLGVRWQPFGDWHLEGDGLFSRTSTLLSEVFNPTFFTYVNGQPYGRSTDTIKEGDLKLDGTLWSSGGSSIKAAVGGSYRAEDFNLDAIFENVNNPTSRRVHAAFAEVYASLITAANALPGIRRLDLSAAVRDDSYSDFGSKTNPRLGIFWSPVDQLGVRAAYSTSFRAPDPAELFNAESGNTVFIESGFPTPADPTGKSSVLFYGNQILHPETSKNLTAGLDFTPSSLPTTRFSLNYFRIVYDNRIITPPLPATVFLNSQTYGSLIKQFPNDAAVEAFVAGLEPPQLVSDFTPGQTGLAGVRYGYEYSAINVAREKTEGLDVGAHSLIALNATDKLVLDFNATYTRDLQITFCQTCTTADFIDTYGQPLKLRLRTSAGWSNGIASTNAAVNFANGYSDTNLAPPGRIDSLTTLDLNASWMIHATGTTLSVNILNALNSDPPHTAFSIYPISYDPINADPRGRTLSLQLRQAW
jgi:iron complex outermembrane recepter protein